MVCLQHLPLDVWTNIIAVGVLSQKDVFLLCQVSRPLRESLQDNDLWFGLIKENYFNMLLDYVVDIQKNYPKNHTSCYYSKALQLQKEKALILRSLSEKKLNLEHYIYHYSRDPEHIPVLYQVLVSLREEFEADRAARKPSLDITRLAKVTNVLVAQNYRIGFNYINSLIDSNFKVASPADYEFFWFRMSLFDKTFHHMAHHRKQKLAHIHETLQRQIYEKMILDDVAFPEILLREFGETVQNIEFSSLHVFKLFIEDVIYAICCCLKAHDGLLGVSEEYISSYYLEDFSSARLFANKVKGHEFVLTSVVLRALDDFFTGRFTVTVLPSKVRLPVRLAITKTYLQVHNCFFKIDPQVLNDNRVLHLQEDMVYGYTFGELKAFLGSRYGYSTAKIIAHIEPVDLRYMLDFYLSLDRHSGVVADTFLTRDNVPISGEPPRVPILGDEYEFVAQSLKVLMDKGTIITEKRLQHLQSNCNSLTNFIHFPAFLESISEDTHTRAAVLAYFGYSPSRPNDDILRSISFEGDGIVSIHRTRINLRARAPIISSTEFPTGVLVRLRELHDFGVVIGSFLASDSLNLLFFSLGTGFLVTRAAYLERLIPRENKPRDHSYNFDEVVAQAICYLSVDILGTLLFDRFEDGRFQLAPF